MEKIERGKEGDELLLLSLKTSLPANRLIHSIFHFQDIIANVLVDTIVGALIILQSPDDETGIHQFDLGMYL
jgi:hypothetical protein